MAYKVIILYQLYMPSYFLGTFTEYPYLKADVAICWTTEYIYLVCMFSLTYWYMKKGNWKNKKI